MKDLTSDNLNEVVSSNKNVIVQYGAAWCGACRVTKPKFSALNDEFSDVEFYYVDAEKYPDSRSLAKVDNLPTFAGFKDGKLVGQSTGTNIDKIKGILNEITSN